MIYSELYYDHISSSRRKASLSVCFLTAFFLSQKWLVNSHPFDIPSFAQYHSASLCRGHDHVTDGELLFSSRIFHKLITVGHRPPSSSSLLARLLLVHRKKETNHDITNKYYVQKEDA